MCAPVVLVQDQRRRSERHRDVERATDLRAVELRRRDTDDRHGLTLDEQRSPDDVGIAAETPLPQAIAEDGDAAVRTCEAILGCGEGTAHERHDAKLLEEVAADEQAVHQV